MSRSVGDAARFFQAGVMKRIALIEAGILASDAKMIIACVSDNQGKSLRALDISPAT